MTYRVRNIGIAVALAVVAALLTSLYVTNYKRQVRRGESRVGVLVAARDIPPGTSGAEVVARHLLSTQEVPRQSVVPGAISSPEQIERLVATGPIYAGEQVSARRFRPVAEQGVRGELRGTMRAIQVAGDQNQLLAGTLKAGDRVDVVASLKVSEATDARATRIVLRDLRVLRASGPSGSGKLTAGPAGADSSVLLAVTDTQVQKLFFVLKSSDWTLALRPAVGAADSPESVESIGSLLRDGLRRDQLQQTILGGEGAP